MSTISRRLSHLEKTLTQPGRLITITVPYGQENQDLGHLLEPLNITGADSVVRLVNYAAGAEPKVSVQPMVA